MLILEYSLDSFSDDEIRDLLINLRLKQYLPLVSNASITGDLLSVVENADDLKDMGIDDPVHAKMLLKTIKEMQGGSQVQRD